MKFSLKRLLIAAALFAAISAVCMVNSLAAEAKLGQVDANSLRFRAKPSLNGAELGKFQNGTKILIIDTVENGQWYKVVHNFNTGYVSSEFVTIVDDADIQLGDGLSEGQKVNVRKSPSTSAAVVTRLEKGQRVTVIGVSQGWYKVIVNGSVGYVHAEYLSIVVPLASRGAEASENSENTAAGETPASDSTPTSIQAELIAYAKKFLGCKYVYGANGPKTFDCSGFTTYVYKHFGYSLNRTSAGQLSNGRAVEKKNLQPGDLVIFRDTKKTKNAASHVGIYIGDNKFIHASSAGRNVMISSLSENYYSKYYVGGRRIL